MKTTFTLLAIFFLFSCSSDDEPDCSAVICEIKGLQIKLVDEIDNSNYIDNNELVLTDFILSFEENTSLSTPSLSLFKNLDDETLIFIPFSDSITITIEDEKNISVSVSNEGAPPSECCGKDITNAQSESHDSSYDLESNILTIRL